MGKVQSCRSLGSRASITLVHFMDRDAQTRVIVGGGPIVDVRGISSSSDTCEGGSGYDLKQDNHNALEWYFASA